MNVQAPLLTLTEAITSIALDRMQSSDGLANAMKEAALSLDRADLYALCQATVSTLCDAGFSGALAFWGVRAFGQQCDASAIIGKQELLNQADFLHYRRYLLCEDTLWRHTDKLGNQPMAEAGEYADAFVAHAAMDCIREVKIERVGFDAWRQAQVTSPLFEFSDAERMAWITSCQLSNGDEAYKHYRRDPRCDGTKQDQFRKEWRRLRPPKFGRPRKPRDK